MKKIQLEANIKNRIGLVLDASDSMKIHKTSLIKIVDNQIKNLAEATKQNGQETRITIWLFSGYDEIECMVWDVDVLRLPSIADLYDTYSMTALHDATLKAISDFKTTSQIYGNNSFLLYVVTDGENNNSRHSASELAQVISELPDNWTVAALVPNAMGVAKAKLLGIPAGNIQVWDATTKEGLERAGRVIYDSTTAYMTARATTGLRSTTSLFDMSATAVNKQTIAAAGLTPLDPREYVLVPVIFPKPFQDGDDRIDNFVARMGHQYVVGRGFYQLTLEPVKVQVNKEIAVVEKKSGKVFVGRNARALLGLPDITVTLRASQNPDYDVFIQSTSLNRKLLLGQMFLYLTPSVTYVRGQVTPAVLQAQPKVAKMPPAAPRVAVPVSTGSKKAKLDLTAPVYSKAGKALWADYTCPVCSSGVNKRCQNSDGSPMEKPHAQRKSLM